MSDPLLFGLLSLLWLALFVVDSRRERRLNRELAEATREVSRLRAVLATTDRGDLDDRSAR